jgi:hypothetical protein
MAALSHTSNVERWLALVWRSLSPCPTICGLSATYWGLGNTRHRTNWTRRPRRTNTTRMALDVITGATPSEWPATRRPMDSINTIPYIDRVPCIAHQPICFVFHTVQWSLITTCVCVFVREWERSPVPCLWWSKETYCKFLPTQNSQLLYKLASCELWIVQNKQASVLHQKMRQRG